MRLDAGWFIIPHLRLSPYVESNTEGYNLRMQNLKAWPHCRAPYWRDFTAAFDGLAQPAAQLLAFSRRRLQRNTASSRAEWLRRRSAPRICCEGAGPLRRLRPASTARGLPPPGARGARAPRAWREPLGGAINASTRGGRGCRVRAGRLRAPPVRALSVGAVRGGAAAAAVGVARRHCG